MRIIVVGLLVAVALFETAAEAQTVTGRIPPERDADSGQYTYGPLYWDIEAAPSSARSDEFSLYLYYNKKSAVMAAKVLCRAPGEELEEHALSFSGEHFLSLTTGLFPGEGCVLVLEGTSDRDETLSYRMAVSKRVTRPTTTIAEPAISANSWSSGYGDQPSAASTTLRKFPQAVAKGRRP